jgi:hypothetical protein
MLLGALDVGLRQELRAALARFMDVPMHMHFVDTPEQSFEVVDAYHYKMLLGFSEALMQRVEEQET